MANPLVSVIIAVYNDAGRLPRSVDAIRAQSVDDWEILIANDGSSDASLDVGRRLAADDPRIRVLDLPHGGAARARNAAAQVARGEWLAIQDSDDYSVPGRLERQLAVLERHPSVGVLGSYGRRVVEGRPLGVVASGPTSIAAFRAGRETDPTYVINGTVMMRRRLFLAAAGYPEDYRVGEDLALYSLRLAFFCDILVLPEPLVCIEVRPDSLSRVFAAEIVQADDVIRLNLARRRRGEREIGYRAAVEELNRAPWFSSLGRRRRRMRHAWFARGAAALSVRSASGVLPLLSAMVIAPRWTLQRLVPRLFRYW